MRKNEVVMMKCERLGNEMEGICFYDGIPVFVPGALPGETVTVQILKDMTRYAYGKLLEIESKSENRRKPFCPVFEKCGGCSGQHMSYVCTLEAKRRQIFDCLSRIGHLPVQMEDIPPVIGAEKPEHCRNKTAIPVGGTAEQPILGFYRKRSHDLVEAAQCPVSMPSFEGVIAAVRQWMISAHIQPYQEKNGHGWLRHVVIRENRRGEFMVVLCACNEKVPNPEGLIHLLENIGSFHSLHISVNRSRGNVIMGPTSQKLWGKDNFYETLLGLKFTIAPLSFFQVNPIQTEKLYQNVLEFCSLNESNTVVDAYAGAGTISLCMARHCKRVIGIEIVPQAVESAIENAKLNGIANAEFHVAAVEDLLPKLVEQGLQPDVIVLDPPRKGVEPAVIEAVLKAAPDRLVYVSCNPATLARDMRLFYDGGYHMERCQGLDMFCYASGVETVVLLSQRVI